MIPLFTNEQVREADNFAIDELKIPSTILMENASKSIFDAIFDKFPDLDKEDTFGILCGKGNNGGDGFALAKHLSNHGFSVKIILVGKLKELKGDPAINAEIVNNLLKYHKNSEIIEYKSVNNLNKLKSCSVIVDALLGTGAKGSLREPYNTIVKKVNGIDSYKVAVDIPTGLDSDKSTGEVIFNADLTVTLAEFKQCLFYEKGYVNCGEIRKGYIGTGSEYFDSLVVKDYLVEPEDAFYALPERKKDAYKYSTGKVKIVAGSKEMPGAAVFTTNAVTKIGAGAVYLAYPESSRSVVQSQMDVAILKSYDDRKHGFMLEENIEEIEMNIKESDAVIIGPGLGRDKKTVNAVQKVLIDYQNKKFVIDADAIWALSRTNNLKKYISNCILTPHHGEFANLIDVNISELKENVVEYGRKFAVENNCVLVLKGAPTIIFNGKGESFINSSGNEGLAKFGSGDVLTGIIGGLLAQTHDLERSAVCGTYLHGLIADLLKKDLTEFSFDAKDLIVNIPTGIKFLRDSFV